MHNYNTSSKTPCQVKSFPFGKKSLPVSPVNEVKPQTFDLVDTTERVDNSYYLDVYAKTDNGIFDNEKIDNDDDIKCRVGWIKGECENGHPFVKALLCGREWCDVCGKDGSMAHKRRMARWWGKIMQMGGFGYLVITIPDELREFFKNVDNLRALRRYWVRKLVREGYKRGLARWHWGSEKQIGRWNPHLNMIFDGGWVQKVDLERWREEYRGWLVKFLGVAVDRVVINYQYRYTKKHKIHKLKYITRATLRWFDPDLASLLYGFNTSVTWGAKYFNKEFKDEYRDGKDKEWFMADMIHRKICPFCEKKITWSGYVPSVDMYHFKQIAGSGYYVDRYG